MVCNGEPTREWLGREETASPTAHLESVHLSAMTDVHEARDAMTGDAEYPDMVTHQGWR